MEIWTYLIGVVALLASVQGVKDRFSTYRSLFVRVPNTVLSSRPSTIIQNSTLEECAKTCVMETRFQCKSFDFSHSDSHCLLHTVNIDDPTVGLATAMGKDHYKTGYVNMFSRIPNHVLTLRHNRKLPGISVESCARRCILELTFKCRGFDYQGNPKICWLTELTPQTAGGVQIFAGADYYERSSEGPLSHFINYGFGSLRPLTGSQIYNQIQVGVTLEACATLCLSETSFKCISFDYTFTDNTCHLSEYIAANVYGMATNYNFRVMHFELAEEYMRYFYVTPYSLVLGNNHKTYTRVTPNRCARMCLEEETFVCRSFDYQVREGTCLLSTQTGSDVGGLFNQGLAEVHHFEMKPLLACGGNLTGSKGDFATPHWPRNYSPNENCVWRVLVPVNRVIHFNFIHFDLGVQTGDPCDPINDRVIIQETRPSGIDHTYCLGQNTKLAVTQTNDVSLSFFSNVDHNAQGFRVFFTAEWTCNVLLTDPRGEIASPGWPDSYEPSTRCYWHIKAPRGQTIRLDFSDFELEQHHFGDCSNIYDHVKVYDGSGITSGNLGTFCGSQPPHSILTTSNEMFVVFFTDQQIERKGFRASYTFQHSLTTGPAGRGTPKTSAGGNVFTPPITLPPKVTERPSTTKPFFVPTKQPGKNDVNTTKSSLEGLVTSKGKKKDENSENEIGEKGLHAAEESESKSKQDGGSSSTTIWAVIVTILIIIIILVILFFLYRRRRNRGEELKDTNYTYNHETMSLQNGDSNTQNIYACIDEQPPTTAFANPLYSKRDSRRHSDVIEKPESDRVSVGSSTPEDEMHLYDTIDVK